MATDHCPFCFKEQKELGKSDFTKIPNGSPGIEHRLQLIYDGGVNEGRISLNRWVELVSTAPAKMFGLYPLDLAKCSWRGDAPLGHAV